MLENAKTVQGPKTQTVIMRRSQEAAIPESHSSEIVKQRYGKRFFTIGNHSIIVDYHRDNSTTMYVMDEQGNKLIPVIKGVHRDKAKETAMLISRLMDTYETLAEKGESLVELTVSK